MVGTRESIVADLVLIPLTAWPIVAAISSDESRGDLTVEVADRLGLREAELVCCFCCCSLVPEKDDGKFFSPFTTCVGSAIAGTTKLAGNCAAAAAVA